MPAPSALGASNISGGDNTESASIVIDALACESGSVALALQPFIAKHVMWQAANRNPPAAPILVGVDLQKATECSGDKIDPWRHPDTVHAATRTLRPLRISRGSKTETSASNRGNNSRRQHAVGQTTERCRPSWV
jgi:hypothetical protein